MIVQQALCKEMFDKAQAVFEKNKRKKYRHREYLLYGKVSCGCCGFALSYSDSVDIEKYHCPHTHADPAAKCHKMTVNAHELEDAVMTIIKKQAEIVLESGDLPELRKMNPDEKQIVECEKQIRQCTHQLQERYEQFIQNKIDGDAFNTLKNECSVQHDKLTNRLALYKQSERDNRADEKAKTLAKEALSETATPKDIVSALIEKVYIFPDKKIEICWKFANFASGLE